ncbi:MAG: hypothetical protein KJ044_09680, partial [Planctomycetes bacterium]|nr:hypothetical protein [Planctomycetota bacterium]
MTDLEVILASHAAGEPRGDLPAGDQPQLAQWAGLCRAMREAAPRPSQERRQALQARLFARRSAPWLWAAPFAAAACLVLALALWSVWQPQTPPQAPLAAVNTPRQRPAPTTNHTVTPTPPESQPETLPGWLDEQWRLVFATRAELPEASPPLGGPRAGGGGTSGSASLLAPVLAQAPFRPLAWPGSPAGFALAGASVKRA